METEDLRLAAGPVWVERGVDDSVLLIAFTGAEGKLMLPVYDFFDTTRALGFSRILLRDPNGMRYHRGIDRQRPDFPSLVEYLRREIERLKPKKVLCLGTSSGGYAAIRAAHALGADYVHAFSPQTSDLSSDGGASSGRFTGRLLKNRLLGWLKARPINLARLLAEPNRKTTYYIHYCAGCGHDRSAAEHLRGSPGVVTLGYPCDTHLIAVFLAKAGFLKEIFAVANQNSIAQVAAAFFPQGVETGEPLPPGGRQ